MLPDDVLLEIFDFYMNQDEDESIKRDIEELQRLVHVCRVGDGEGITTSAEFATGLYTATNTYVHAGCLAILATPHMGLWPPNKRRGQGVAEFLLPRVRRRSRRADH
jgi:hypothetical protein